MTKKNPRPKQVTQKPSALEQRYLSRRTSILKLLKGQAALFSAAEEKTKSRDQHHNFKQDSDFFYLTGIEEPESALLLLGNNKGPRSILFLRDRDPRFEIWNGERIGIRRAKRRFRVDEVRDIKSLDSCLGELLTQSETLHYALGTNSKIDDMIWSLLRSSIGPRINVPRTLSDSRLITSQMRVVKDRDEIRTIRHVAELTARSFVEFMPQVTNAKSERHAATILEGLFARYGADDLAFSTIVASGNNATTLHHSPTMSPVWQRELVLVDAGASFRGYAADITRTFPPTGKFSAAQADIYDVVHYALEKAKDQSKPHSTLDDIHLAAVKAITSGLVDLKILRGNVQHLVAQKAYLPYYMHRTGHWMGIDVHDISPIYMDEYLIPPASRPLEPGNIFTIEPGLYFSANDQSVPARYRGIGVRIEDDILITKEGHDVLTKSVPSSREEIEALLK